MKTLHISIIIGIMLTSCLVLPNANAQDCFGGQSCGGKSSFSFMDGKNVAVNLKFYSNSTVSNNVHYLWLQFFDKNTNQTIPHVSFFLNATKDNKVLMHELFYSHTGSMTLQFSSGSDMGKWIVSGTAEPVLGGMMSDNDMLPIEIPAFTPGTYHIHLVVLALVFANGLVDQNNPPTFDSWWSVDDKGNISKYETISNLSYANNETTIQTQMIPNNQVPPFNTNYSSNPVIITQVELATALQPGNQSGTDCAVYPNGTKICQSYYSPYSTNVHSPYYNIQCAFFNGICQLTHQVEMLGNQCDSLQQYPQGTQWIQIYNQMNSTVRLTHFGVTRILDDVLHLQNMPPQYSGTDYAGSTNLTMSPYQICSYGFIAGPIGSALEFPLNDTSLAIVYDQDGVHHVAATPFLADSYNDTRTWQFNGEKWTFAEQNTVSVPEFPFAVPVMLIGIVSAIGFYRMRFWK